MKELPQRKRCLAATDHGPCRKWALKGGTRCGLHGQKGGRPVLTGRRSRLRAVFGEKWDAIAADPATHRFEADLALFIAREDELAGRLAGGDDPSFRTDALRLFQEFDGAVNAGDRDGAVAGKAALQAHLERGGDRDAAWSELLSNARHRAQLAKTAIEAMTRAETAITQADLKLFVRLVQDTLYRELSPGDADRCSEQLCIELSRLVGGSGERPALPPGLAESYPLSG